MAYDDIQWHSSPDGQPWVLHYPAEASQTFGKGDVVSSDQDGQVTEGADELVPEDLLGIAAAGPNGPGGITLNNPRTNAAYADGDRFPVIIPRNHDLFITKNFTSDGTTFSNTAPAAANIGDVISLPLISGVWGVEQGGTGTAAVGTIVDILNVRKESILDTGETLATTDTFYILFTITSHQHSATAEMVGATG